MIGVWRSRCGCGLAPLARALAFDNSDAVQPLARRRICTDVVVAGEPRRVRRQEGRLRYMTRNTGRCCFVIAMVLGWWVRTAFSGHDATISRIVLVAVATTLLELATLALDYGEVARA